MSLVLAYATDVELHDLVSWEQQMQLPREGKQSDISSPVRLPRVRTPVVSCNTTPAAQIPSRCRPIQPSHAVLLLVCRPVC